MLNLLHIRKDYITADETVHALDDVSIRFRKNEFVSILGPSGCGKTTLLNLIGGLDAYTAGDLQINGRSTKEYKARDWDTYRNHSVGFVFQNYNLIPHQSVLANVELALTLAGVSREERHRRAKEALCRVGLEKQMHKRPNQMSGGQMQRVAIARALVNDPEILLADEPTGALDTKTSVQVMELLKEIANDRLVIMVTHNPDLAAEYSTRIIRLLDGRIMDDTDPWDGVTETTAAIKAVPNTTKVRKKKKRSMSMLTAFSLSLNNLLTKKTRTLLTSVAGSIGIIGIALIMALSNGINTFIQQMQQDTLSSYPITLQSEEMDMAGMLTSLMGNANGEEHELDKVYSSVVMYELMDSMLNAETTTNNLEKFKEYLESDASLIPGYASAIQYSYGVTPCVYVKDVAGHLVKVDAMDIFESAMGDVSSSSMMSSYTNLMTSSATLEIWEELLGGKEDENGNRAPVSELLKQQYDLLEGGSWPEEMNEIVLVVNERNEISDVVLYALGLKDRAEVADLITAIMMGDAYDMKVESWDYSELLNMQFKLVMPTDLYQKNPVTGLWSDVSADPTVLDMITDEGLTLKISGIIRPKPDVTATAITGSIGYTYMLTDYIISGVLESELAKEQMDPANANRDVLNGLPFQITAENELSPAEKKEAFSTYVKTLSQDEKAALYTAIMTTPAEDVLKAAVDKTMEAFLKDPSAAEPVYDREKMESMIFTLMGSGSSLVQNYISKLTDAELADLIRQGVKERVLTELQAQYEKGMQQMFVQTTVAAVTSSLTDRTMKIGYLAQAYQKQTGMPPSAFSAYLAGLSDEELDAAVRTNATKDAQTALAEGKGEAYKTFRIAALNAMLESDTTDFEKLYDGYMPETVSKSTLEDNLELFGVVDKASPKKIILYADTFDNKEAISADIAAYNRNVSEEDEISYTDYVELFISSIRILVDAVSYVLIAFVSISLVVSSIMIGIITYISVLERTKEIGVLRAVGASCGDVSRVFNAETLIVGFAAGAIGMLVSAMLCIPINAIIAALSGVTAIKAALPWEALLLVVLSMLLTFVAGLIPSRIAAHKDPVVALRTE